MVNSGLLLVVVVITLLSVSTATNYWEERDKLIKAEQSLALGSNIELNDLERKANNILMTSKNKEIDDGFLNPGNFSPSQHFFEARPNIEKSKVFQFIKRIPKGSLLHAHDFGMVSFEYLYSITYKPNLYGCIVDDMLKFRFLKSAGRNKNCKWILVEELRKSNVSFDSFLKSQLSLVVKNPRQVYPNENVIWEKFNKIFATIEPLVTYKPVFQEYFYQVLQELYDDNVMYLEFRGYLPHVYDLNQHLYEAVEVVGFYKETLDVFKFHHKKFQGARLIYAPVRSVNNITVEEYIKTFTLLKSTYPDFVAGFDLVGQEDLGRPLMDFVYELNKTPQNHLRVPKDTKYFFHAGETNWYGESTDLNLVDAVLLGSKRIGHGYALNKHPEVLRIVKEKEIAIEINPISNQVLNLVDDIRNHPGNLYIGQGYPVVICNDDPTFWGAKGLSYDWYMAFMGMSSRSSDLRLLKQLALNSYLYNAMDDMEKNNAIEEWKETWNEFIQKILNVNKNGGKRILPKVFLMH